MPICTVIPFFRDSLHLLHMQTTVELLVNIETLKSAINRWYDVKHGENYFLGDAFLSGKETIDVQPPAELK